MSLLEIRSFIKDIKPFNNLSTTELQEISDSLDIIYFNNEEEIITKDQKADFLYFIIKGLVQEKQDDEVTAIYSKKQFFDPIILIENKTKHTYVTAQESICYTLPKDVFLKFMYQNEALERYFFSSISEKLNQNTQNEQNKKLLNFAVAKVEDAYLQKPIYVDETQTIHQTVTKLKENNIQAMLVKSKGGDIGIVTDSDFVKKAILNRIDLDQPISTITTYNLKYINATDFLFNAQLMMSKDKLKRIVVQKDDNIVGILDIVSLSSFFASHTQSTSKLIDSATTIEQLKEASSKFIKTIRALYEKGVKVRYISKLVSTLNEKLFEKLFDITAPLELKENSSLIIMGSEGRGEQILRTDQDNALILHDNCKINKDELNNFTQQFTNHLVEFGYPLCDGNIMISNPFWVQTQSDFRDTIFNWIHKPNEDSLMNLAIFIDAISVAGKKDLLDELKEYLYTISLNAPSFYSFFAKPTNMFETPLGFFSDFIVDKNQHKDQFDIKKGGIFTLVHGTRALSIENRVTSTNTIERLKELNNLGVIDREFTSEIIESFNFLLTLRLRFRLMQIDSGEQLDNYINPSKLTTLEKDLLKDCLKIVNKFKKFITFHYKLNQIS